MGGSSLALSAFLVKKALLMPTPPTSPRSRSATPPLGATGLGVALETHDAATAAPVVMRQTVNGLPPQPNAVRGTANGVAAQQTAMPPRAAAPQHRVGLGTVLADMNSSVNTAELPRPATQPSQHVLGRAHWPQPWGRSGAWDLPRQVSAFANAPTVAHWLHNNLPGAIKSVAHYAVEGVAAAGAAACLVSQVVSPVIPVLYASMMITASRVAFDQGLPDEAQLKRLESAENASDLFAVAGTFALGTWLLGAAATHAAVRINQGSGPVTRHLAQGTPARPLITNPLSGCVYASALIRRALWGGDNSGGTLRADAQITQTRPQLGAPLPKARPVYHEAMVEIEKRHWLRMEHRDVKVSVEQGQKILDEVGDHDLKSALLHRQEILDEVGHHEWFLPQSNEYKDAVDELLHSSKGTQNPYRIATFPPFESIQNDAAKVADEAILYVRGAKSKFTA
jgi:hypothetical protein